MAQFDIFELSNGGLVVDCQSDLLSDMDTRFVVPLVLPALVKPTGRLNPGFEIESQCLLLAPQGAATIPARELRHHVGSLAEQGFVILNALDFLLTGS